jgi:hypothetical protein
MRVDPMLPLIAPGLMHGTPYHASVSFDLAEGSIVSPTQFMTQCVTNWKSLIKEPHVTEVGGIEAFSELGDQGGGQGLHEAAPVLGPARAALLEHDDVTPDLPAGLDLDGVDGTDRPVPRALDQTAEIVNQFGGSILRQVDVIEALAHGGWFDPMLPAHQVLSGSTDWNPYVS